MSPTCANKNWRNSQTGLNRYHCLTDLAGCNAELFFEHAGEVLGVFEAQREHWQEMAKMASLNQEKRYFNMTYQQIKDWMENYEIWD